jgi:NlpC/P60 family putative phage cell wall peptidase
MRVTRAQVVAEARSWIGTAYQHQQRMKGVAVDCMGLPIGVARALGILEPSVDLLGYSRQPDGTLLTRVDGEATAYLEKIDQAAMQPGDLALLATQVLPNHFGIVADYRYGGLTLIHAVPLRGVVEHRIDSTWRKRIVAAYRPRGILIDA